jgi:hypothetical protein
VSEEQSSVTRTLKKPVQVTINPGKADERIETIDELTMRTEVKAKDLRAIDGSEGDVAKAIALVAHLTGQPVRVIDELSKDDFGFFAEKLGAL